MLSWENRKPYWEYIDSEDISDICEILLDDKPNNLPQKQLDGWVEAVQDVKYFAELGLASVDNHMDRWEGHVATSAHDHGYMQALDEIRDAVGLLLRERKI